MDMLEKLYAAKLLVREADERREPIELMRERAHARRAERRGFKAALQAASGPAIIAEIKRASPSLGLIVRSLDPAQIARDYDAAGADAISVLTEADHFLGDLAYLDEDGFLYICGRKKDMIIRGGNNIYATDVEAVLLEHPDVQEAAVTGVPHPVLGEDVAAWVVPRTDSELDRDQLLAFVAGRLADYKRPRQLHLVDALPRNATGKVMKHRLEVPPAP